MKPSDCEVGDQQERLSEHRCTTHAHKHTHIHMHARAIHSTSFQIFAGKIFRAGGPNAFGPLLSLQRSPQHNSWSLAAHAWAA
eukprot:scaffold103685_cov15-Tisochrysis_lutea.AAC.1